MIEISGTTRIVGILGWPVEHSLSPRMQNAAFAAVGLDWAYVALPTPPEHLAEAVAGLAALGFAGANVTAPHKLAVASLCETDAPSVNTLVVRDGRIEAWSTDAAILDALPSERPVVIGDGGAAAAFVHALPHARRFSRRAEWPPDVTDADLVINATAARDEVLVELRSGQISRRPSLPGDCDGTCGDRGRRVRRQRARGSPGARGGVVRALDGTARACRRHASRAGLVH